LAQASRESWHSALEFAELFGRFYDRHVGSLSLHPPYQHAVFAPQPQIRPQKAKIRMQAAASIGI